MGGGGKKKRQKSEDFIGWKSEDGKLEVIDIVGKRDSHATFKVTCTECSKDKELFPDGYFVCVRSILIKGVKPCGCGRGVRWKDWQYLILARRAAKGRFVVHGFAEEFHGQQTKLNLECLKDGYKWTASIDRIINGGNGCPKCSGNAKPTEQEALQKCIDICREMRYNAIGFTNGYKNNKSRFSYICKTHGTQEVNYNNFVNNKRRCGGCAKDESGLYGYYPERSDEVDFLYVLDFNGEYVKVGRSFDVDERIKNLKYESKIKKIHKLRIFTSTHQEIYNFEQEMHNELRSRNFQHYVDWSTECFEKDCQHVLNELLNNCVLDEIKLQVNAGGV